MLSDGEDSFPLSRIASELYWCVSERLFLVNGDVS